MPTVVLPGMLKLQRAASATHRHGQLIDAVRNTAALTLAVIGLVVTATGHGHTILTVLAVTSATPPKAPLPLKRNAGD